jgi:hypothetical protein
MRDTNLAQVSVRVTWTARGQERFVNLASMIYAPDTTGNSGTGTGTTGTGTGTKR